MGKSPGTPLPAPRSMDDASARHLRRMESGG
jgi:hypothetical protein